MIEITSKCLWILVLLIVSGMGKTDSYVYPYIYLDKVSAALESFQKDCGHYPSESEGLFNLIESSKPCWQGPYLTERFLNGYRGRPIKYELIEGRGQLQVQLSTFGEDLLWDTHDDICLSDDPKTRQKKFRRIIKFLDLKKSLSMILFVLGFFAVVMYIFYWLCKLWQFTFPSLKSFIKNELN